MPYEELAAILIVKGSKEDEFLWDHESVDDDGVVHLGGWKMALEKKAKGSSVVKNAVEYTNRNAFQ